MIIESPQDARIQAEVDRSTLALRVSHRPQEYAVHDNIGGHYRIALTTGLTTILNAADAILSLRWTNQQFNFALLRLKAYASLTTAFAAAQETSLDIVRMLNFTANDSGGSAITLGAHCRKTLSPMNPSRISDLRIATTVALGAGTGTAESLAFGKVVLPLGNVLGASAEGALFEVEAGLEAPFIMSALNGFRVRIGFTQGATGVVRFTLVMDWAEIPIAV